MTTMTPMAIWSELERDPAEAPSGYLARRVAGTAVAEMWLAVDRPRNHRHLLVRVSAAALLRHQLESGSQAIEISTARITTPRDREYIDVVMALRQPGYADLFGSLVEDLIRHLSTCTKADEVPGRLLARLSRWQQFLRLGRLEGLSEQEQRGLFGELWFLRMHLLPALGAAAAVDAWVAPLSASQDFQIGPVAIEVKCTSGQEPQQVQIHGGRQLDAQGLDHLLLYVLSVDTRRGLGETLEALVGTVRNLLDVEPAARTRFEGRLFEAGYLDAHRVRYEQPGYTIKKQCFYRVTEGFPCIVESALPAGIGDLRYSISLAACTSFIIPMPGVREILTGERT